MYFRIIAKNKGGLSDPSGPSRSLLAKSRRVPPKIDRSTFNEIRVKKDGIIEFNVAVEGEPAPKIQWLINNAPLSGSERVKIDNSTDNRTKLRTISAERLDSGKYKIVVCRRRFYGIHSFFLGNQ